MSMLKKILSLFLLTALISCSGNSTKDEEVNLTLHITAKQKIDSVFISNMAQDRDFMFLPFKDTIEVTLKDSINDLYNVWMYSGGKQYSRGANQFWLSGNQITIKGTFDNGFVLDTLIGSDLYYKSLEFQKGYAQVSQNQKTGEEVNQYLLNFTKENLDNVLSLQSSGFYISNNGNDREKIKQLKEIIKDQDESLRQHAIFQPHKKIEKILSLEKIDISKYAFTSVAGKSTKITLEPNKKYLFDLWFMACPPCIKDHKEFKKNPELLSKKNIEIIGLSIDDDQEKWVKFVNKNSYPWKNYRQSSYENSMSDDLMINIFPTYYLVESDGTIEASFNSYYEIQNYLTN